jgi:hypothetical protein
MGELLSKSEFAFNKNETLTWNDVRFLKDGSVQILNKIPKNRTPGGETIDLFAYNDSCCPVAALKRLWKDLSHNLSDPVFRFESGKLLTMKLFNEVLRDCLSVRFGQKANCFSGHSFRAGLPSALSSCHSLASEAAIKKWGRWKSDAYEKYTKLNHEAKREVFDLFSKALNREK